MQISPLNASPYFVAKWLAIFLWTLKKKPFIVISSLESFSSFFTRNPLREFFFCKYFHLWRVKCVTVNIFIYHFIYEVARALKNVMRILVEKNVCFWVMAKNGWILNSMWQVINFHYLRVLCDFWWKGLLLEKILKFLGFT